jgi:hypothetical protein
MNACLGRRESLEAVLNCPFQPVKAGAKGERKSFNVE